MLQKKVNPEIIEERKIIREEKIYEHTLKKTSQTGCLLESRTHSSAEQLPCVERNARRHELEGSWVRVSVRQPKDNLVGGLAEIF